jgi:hypothetical protein
MFNKKEWQREYDKKNKEHLDEWKKEYARKNKSHLNKYKKEWARIMYKKDPEKAHRRYKFPSNVAKKKEWMEKHSVNGIPYRRLLHIKKSYGITTEKYMALLEKQDNKCSICGLDFYISKRELCIDHDHATGKIRGLLCDRCNWGLGQFKDDIVRLQKAIEYLIRNQED